MSISICVHNVEAADVVVGNGREFNRIRITTSDGDISLFFDSLQSIAIFGLDVNKMAAQVGVSNGKTAGS